MKILRYANERHMLNLGVCVMSAFVYFFAGFAVCGCLCIAFWDAWQARSSAYSGNRIEEFTLYACCALSVCCAAVSLSVGIGG